MQYISDIGVTYDALREPVSGHCHRLCERHVIHSRFGYKSPPDAVTRKISRKAGEGGAPLHDRSNRMTGECAPDLRSPEPAKQRSV